MTQTHHPADFVGDWIAGNATFFPGKTATVDMASGRRRTYAQLHDRVARVAGYLRQLGVVRGDRVCVLAPNSTDLIDLQFACWRLGALYVPLNFRLTASELAYIVADAGPRAMFVDQQFDTLADAVLAEAPVAHRIGLDGLGGDSPFEAGTASAAPLYTMIDQHPDDLCMLMYSSGTTGRPKGVTFTHRMIQTAAVNTAPGMQVSNEMVGLTAMPLFHIGGLMAFSVSCLFFGATTVIQRAFDPGETLAAISDPGLGVTHMLAVPAMFNAMKTHPDQPRADFSRMRLLLAGAESVPEPLVRWWLDRGVPVQEVYGLTETCGAVCFVPKADLPAKIGTAGHILPFCRVRLVDDAGRDVPRGERGEIWVAGGNVTQAYWNRPDANAECFPGGWFRTGDIGRMDADGCLIIEDRLKDMYISGGENVYPAEVENVLYAHEAIAEVAVIGVPDPQWGEVGCAVVAPKTDAAIDHDDLLAHCAPHLARFKHPRHVHLMESLPRNATGKVLKYQLRDIVIRELGLS